MSDIVVRLRFWGDSYHLHKESADEIEKLRAENAKLAASNHAYLSDYQEARGEIEKLRAALLLARVAVSHACELSDRILYTQDLVRIDAALGEKE